MNAGDVMTQSTVTVDPEASIMHAIHLMLKRRISGLPVVDSTGALVGIVTTSDLLRALAGPPEAAEAVLTAADRSSAAPAPAAKDA